MVEIERVYGASPSPLYRLLEVEARSLLVHCLFRNDVRNSSSLSTHSHLSGIFFSFRNMVRPQYLLGDRNLL